MQMVAADWLKSDKREDDLGGRAGSIVQVYHLISIRFMLNYIFCLVLTVGSHLCIAPTEYDRGLNMDLTAGMILQKFAAKGGPEFFFIVNIQVNLLLSPIFD